LAKRAFRVVMVMEGAHMHIRQAYEGWL
jgi:hypothetical protein